MEIGQKVIIKDTNSIWDGKEGIVEEILDNGKCTVFVDFIPEERKRVRQDFNVDNLSYEDYNIVEELTPLKEEPIRRNDMADIIKEIDWNGHHYTFTEKVKHTGTKTHDILTMEDENGNSWTGETTWINRPWHRFDLEEAFVEIVSKAFGPKAQELILKINKDAHSVENAIDTFFSQFKEEDIQANEVTKYDDSEEARKQALAKYLEVNPELIESNGDNEFSYDGATYKVLTDSEADYEAEEAIRGYWEDVGLDGIGGYLHDWILENAIDEDSLEDIVRDDITNDIYDWLSDEEVVDNCIEEGIVSEDEVHDEDGNIKDDVDIDDLREQLSEYRFNQVDSYAEYLRDAGFGDEYFVDFIDDDLVIDALKDDADVNGSGRGQELAYYDGEEIELDGNLFAYRID